MADFESARSISEHAEELGSHKEDCACLRGYNGGDCDCGLDAAREWLPVLIDEWISWQKSRAKANLK